MTQIDGSVSLIIDLHHQLVYNARKSLDLAIELGELLIQQKANAEHGQWTNWVVNHLPFTPRTASNYMRLFRIRDEIRSESVSDLISAYRLLAGPSRMDQHEAARASVQIQADLHDLATDTLTFVGAIRQVREQTAFAPEFPSFEAYLLSLNLTPGEFEAKEQLCDALIAWVNGGSAGAVFSCVLAQQKQNDENL